MSIEADLGNGVPNVSVEELRGHTETTTQDVLANHERMEQIEE